MSRHPLAYVAVMGLSITTGLLVARATQRPLPITRAQRFAILFGAAVGGVVFAKIPYLLMDLRALASGAGWLENGRTLTCGLAGGYFGVEAAKWATGVRVKTGDGFAVPLSASIAVGRIGCFVGGCCFGAETKLPIGMDFGDGLKRHPTQLYEAAFHAGAMVVLVWMGKRGLFPRQRVKIYFIAYFIYRFFTEYIRPEPRVAMGLTFYQWASIVLGVVFVGLYGVDRRGTLTPALSRKAGRGRAYPHARRADH